MKKKACIMIILAVLAASAYAQTAFDYLTDSVVNLIEFSKLMQITDYEYNGDNALWGTYLEPGKAISLSSEYDGGIEYLMFASAHTQKANIDLKVYRGQNTKGAAIAKDTAPDAAPIVRFTPSDSGLYCFELINSGDQPAFVSLLILKATKDAGFSLNALSQALSSVLTVSGYVDSLLSPNSTFPANKWILFGGNVRKGNKTVSPNIKLAKLNYVLVGAGEESVTNCDAGVVEQYTNGKTDSKEISQNTDSQSPVDFAAFSPVSSKHYCLQVVNKDSENDTSFIFGFLIPVK